MVQKIVFITVAVLLASAMLVVLAQRNPDVGTKQDGSLSLPLTLRAPSGSESFDAKIRDPEHVTVEAVKLSPATTHLPVAGKVKVEGVLQNGVPDFHIDRDATSVVLRCSEEQTVFGEWRAVGKPRNEVYYTPLEGPNPSRFVRQACTLQDYESEGARRTICATIRTNGKGESALGPAPGMGFANIPVAGDIEAAVKASNDAFRAKYPKQDLSVTLDVTVWTLAAPAKKTDVVFEEREVTTGLPNSPGPDGAARPTAEGHP